MEEEESSEEEDELPMYQEHYDALFSMDFMDTKYPHVDTMKALGIFEDVELVLKNMHLAKLFSYHMESYKELTCEFLASMRYHMYEEEDRADLDQGLGWITFLAKGEKRMVTFRQLEILFGFNYGEGTKWNFKEKELQRVWATIADGVYSSSRSKAAQIRSPVLRYVHKALANTFFARKATGTINEGELKFLDMGIKPLLSRTSDGKRIRGDRSDTWNLMPFLDHLLTYKITAYNTRHQRGRKLSIGGLITPILCAAGVNPTDRRATEPGWMDIKFCKTNLLIEHKELDGRFQFKFTHPLVGPSKFLLPNPELTTVVRGENIDFRPPGYTLVGHEDDLREEEPELDRADRAEGRVDLEEPLFENPGFEYDPTQYQDFSSDQLDPYNRFEQAQLHQGQGSHTLSTMKKKRKRSRKLDRVSQEATQLHGVLLMAVYHLQTTT
ncbi:unnamed protein product [Microthlaspi erraticum]|uniref:Arabidopsis retrotransposon Orf1 C-terminal domain-containing protein n=1 Tax=Microthlaspi erraticum TaxID=1685480 RepID=A0A6D2K7A7_9BRAS|nr:unnamed protein product [Microthlaspi erraticum]